jgi:hypothetical protein
MKTKMDTGRLIAICFVVACAPRPSYSAIAVGEYAYLRDDTPLGPGWRCVRENGDAMAGCTPAYQHPRKGIVWAFSHAVSGSAPAGGTPGIEAAEPFDVKLLIQDCLGPSETLHRSLSSPCTAFFPELGPVSDAAAFEILSIERTEFRPLEREVMFGETVTFEHGSRRRIRSRVVLLRSRHRSTRQATRGREIIHFIGYENDAARFDSGLPDFVRFQRFLDAE